MKIPYNQVHVHGDILFAARGGHVHTFSAAGGAHIATWKHPDVDKVAQAVVAQDTGAKSEPLDRTAEGGAPAAKRQKLEGSDEASLTTAGEAASAPEPASEGGTEAQASKGKGRRKSGKGNGNEGGQSGRSRLSPVPDRPVITHMTATADGKHLLVVTGHDKTIWVFSHDGEGRITQLSQRTMPKRPSAVAIAPDAQIICADKFGDVYALPLIAVPSTASAEPHARTHVPPAKQPWKPSANELTVHSKRNLKALQNQMKHAELAEGSAADEGRRRDVPEFELTLLLGHVSMLTALALAEHGGRRYILTGDRDEHIRVSRSMPQAHIIEGYCLGHKNFVTAMEIPSTKGDVLISGGGDAELFVWDWRAGRVLSTTSVLALSQQFAPTTAKVAVLKISSFVYPSDSGDVMFILVICESLPAILSWQLTEDNELHHPGIIQLPGNPLDLAVFPADGQTPKIAVAIDTGEAAAAQSLSIFGLTMEAEALGTKSCSSVQDEILAGSEMDVSESIIRSLLYTTENLRKHAAEVGDDVDVDPPEAEGTADAE